MHEALTRLGGRGDRLDVAVAAAIAAAAGLGLATGPPRGAGMTVAIAAGIVLVCGALAVRRRWPLLVAIVVGAVIFVPGLVFGSRWWNALPDALLLPCVIVAYTAGSQLDGAPSVIGLIPPSLAINGGDLSSSLATMLVFTVPAWVAGRVMRSRNRLTAALAARAEELEREREAYAHEAVRYERARIGRDLHDIVAHSVSTIVVQAGAGRRVLATDPKIAAESLTHIEHSAQQAELEIGQLVELLAERDHGADGGGLRLLDELVHRAAATGLSVTYRHSGIHDDLTPDAAEAAYRVTQEGITNALKHAPGAPIDIHVHAGTSGVTVTVANGPSSTGGSGLEQVGGGYGLDGLRDRLRSLGGALTAGPAGDGGWQLEAELPRARAGAEVGACDGAEAGDVGGVGARDGVPPRSR